MAIETFVINPPAKRRGLFRLKTRRSQKRRIFRMKANRPKARRLKGAFKMARLKLRRIKLDSNTWFGHPRLHRKASKKAWRLHRKTMLRGVRKGAIRRRKHSRAGTWRRMVKKYGVMKASRRLHKGLRYQNNPATNIIRRRSRRSVRRYSRRGGRSFLGRFTSNPMVATVTSPVKTLISKDFLLGTVAPITGGFVGSRILGDFLGAKILKDKYGTAVWHKPAFVLGAGVAGSILVSLILKKKELGAKILAGSAIAVLSVLIEAPVRKITGVSGMGADLTDDLKRKISSSIREEISKAEGVSAFLTTTKMPPQMGEFLNRGNQPSGVSGVSLDDMMGEVL